VKHADLIKTFQKEAKVIFVSEACRFDQDISKGGEGDYFADSRTNPFE